MLIPKERKFYLYLFYSIFEGQDRKLITLSCPFALTAGGQLVFPHPIIGITDYKPLLLRLKYCGSFATSLPGEIKGNVPLVKLPGAVPNYNQSFAYIRDLQTQQNDCISSSCKLKLHQILQTYALCQISNHSCKCQYLITWQVF